MGAFTFQQGSCIPASTIPSAFRAIRSHPTGDQEHNGMQRRSRVFDLGPTGVFKSLPWALRPVSSAGWETSKMTRPAAGRSAQRHRHPRASLTHMSVHGHTMPLTFQIPRFIPRGRRFSTNGQPVPTSQRSNNCGPGLMLQIPPRTREPPKTCQMRSAPSACNSVFVIRSAVGILFTRHLRPAVQTRDRRCQITQFCFRIKPLH